MIAAVLVVLALVALAVGVAMGARQMHAANGEKFTVLRQYENRPMVVITETGGRIRVPKPVEGVITSVRRRGVTVERDGKERFIPLGGVRGLEDPRGRRVADWW